MHDPNNPNCRYDPYDWSPDSATDFCTCPNKSLNAFAALLGEDEIMRTALQKIWEMPRDDDEDSMELKEVFGIVDDAVAQITKLAEMRMAAQTAPCARCGKDRHGYRHPEFICRYCAGEAE